MARTLEEARATLAVELRSWLARYLPAVGQDGAREGPAPLLLVRAAGGVGKTHTLAQLLKYRRVTWLGERIEGLERLEGMLHTGLPTVTPLAATVATMSIEKRPSVADGMRDGGAGCTQPERVTGVRDLGLGRFQQHLACRGCPDKATCRYQAWTRSTSWLYAPTIWLELNVNNAGLYSGSEVIVIDESPVDHRLLSTKFMPHEAKVVLDGLRQFTPSAFTQLQHQALVDIFSAIVRLLADPPAGRLRVELRRLVEDLGYVFVLGTGPTGGTGAQTGPVARRVSAGASVTEVPEHLAPIDPAAMADLLKVVSLAPDLRGRLVAMADALAHDVGPRPTCMVRLPSREGNNNPGLVLLGRNVQQTVPDHIPMVVLDATGDPSLYGTLYRGRRIDVLDVEVEQEATVFQIVDARYPASSLTPATIDKLLGSVHAYRQVHPTHRVGLVMKGKLREQAAIESVVSKHFPDPTDIESYWSVRGKNHFEAYDALFLLGAPELHPADVEARARALAAHLPFDPSRENACDFEVVPKRGDTTGYVEVEQAGRKYRLPERGLLHFGDTWFFDRHQAELVQAALRIRPFQGRKKHVFVLSNLYLPPAYLAVTYVELKELLLPRGAHELVVALRSLREQQPRGTLTYAHVTKSTGLRAPAISKILSRLKNHRLGQGMYTEAKTLLAGP